jgi:hypothetical protein
VYEEPLPLTQVYRAGHMATLTDPSKHQFEYGTYNKLSLCYAANAYVGLVDWRGSTQRPATKTLPRRRNATS